MILSIFGRYAAAMFLVLAMLLGGASLAGVAANFALQMSSLLIIIALVILAPAPPSAEPTGGRGLVRILYAFIAMVVISLIPLPPMLWSLVPGHARVVDAFALIGEPLPWMPLSLAPADTIWSALSLLPVVAAGLLTFRASSQHDRTVQTAVIIVAVASAILGICQVATGLESALYFYDITNRGLAVGPFANANHLATLMAVAIVQTASCFSISETEWSREKTPAKRIAIVVALDLIFIAASWLTDSIAGQVLAVLALLATPFILRRRALSLRVAWLATSGVMVGAAALLTILSTSGTEASPGAVQAGTARQDIYPRTLSAAADHLPFGSGLGSFAATYQAYEDPTTVNYVYANHAHSDVLELLLETGLIGMAILGALALWLLRQLTMGIEFNGSHAHRARAALLSLLIIGLHSLVDYPLRTAAMATLAAVLIAIVARRSWIEN